MHFEPVRKGCERFGQKPASHTMEHSLGVWGRTDKLPKRGILEISTMCGHGMVYFNLVKEAVEDVRGNRVTAQEAALKLTEPCVCGVFNPNRAVQLLEIMAGM